MKLTTLEGEPAYIDPKYIRDIIQKQALPADTTNGLVAVPRRTVLHLDPTDMDYRKRQEVNSVVVLEEADDIEAMRQAKAETEEA
jgi:hypothetical protein